MLQHWTLLAFFFLIHVLEDASFVDHHEQYQSELHWLPRMLQKGPNQQFMHSASLFKLPALHLDHRTTSSLYIANLNSQPVLGFIKF